MILDLHTHTREHSSCAKQSLEALVRRAAEVGLDGIVITDHDYLWPATELAASLDQLGRITRLVLRGQEVSCVDGHLLVYGIEDGLPAGMTRHELAQWVRAQGGATILAHPFRWGGFSEVPDERLPEALRGFDGLEAWTTNHSEEETCRAARLHGHPGVRLTGASDAHDVDRVGRFALRFDDAVGREHDLVRLLREGAFQPVRLLGGGGFAPCIPLR